MLIFVPGSGYLSMAYYIRLNQPLSFSLEMAVCEKTFRNAWGISKDRIEVLTYLTTSCFILQPRDYERKLRWVFQKQFEQYPIGPKLMMISQYLM